MAQDLRSWLHGLGLGQHVMTFEENDLDLDLVADLTDGDLEKLGVASMGHRKKLLRAIEVLRAPTTSSEITVGTPSTAKADLSAVPSSKSQAERRQLTVMFCDLVGSTALATQFDPEDMGEIIRSYQNTVAGRIAEFEGHVAKFMGDGVLAYFGWPISHEDEAERAVRAGLAVTEAVAELKTPAGEPLATRIGIATGLVVVGDIADQGPMGEQAVVGESPNLAARLQTLAEPNTVVIGPSTRHLVGELFELQDLGPHELKGFQESIRVWCVVGKRAAESRFEARHLAKLSPIVGREHEIALLHDRWARAVEGEGQIVLLSGEAGIGKSRIARSLTEALADQAHTRFYFQCSPFHANSAFHPIIERLERAAGLEKDDPTETKLDKLEALLAPSTDQMAETLPLFAALLSVSTANRYSVLNLNPQQQKQRTLEVLVEEVEALSAQQPVLVLCEDAHWIDPSTQEVFTLLADRIEHLSVLMLLTFRPDFVPPWTRHAHATQLSVSRLTQRHGAEIIDRLAGGKAVPTAIADQILRKAEGVPLFIEELTKNVLDSGLLNDFGSGYDLSGPIPPLAVPATLKDSLMARLDRLGRVKEIAQVAAVVGREFSLDLLTAAAGRSVMEVEEALDQLIASELIFRHGMAPTATYTFKHALVQETAYRSLLRGKRQSLHGCIAKFLEQRFPRIAELQPELLAHHLDEAGCFEPAAEYWLKAGRRSKQRYANKEAKAHLQKCLDATAVVRSGSSRLSAARTEALLLLGDLEGLVENLDQANECYRQALDLAADETARTMIRSKFHRPNVAIRDGNRIAYYEHGSGEDTLLFVSPITYGLAVFQPILELLSQEFRIITIDCRGTGSSDPLTRPFPLSQHVEDVAEVIKASGCSAVTAVGISRGSNLLIKLAIERPAMVSRLVLVGCPLVPPNSGDFETFSPEYLRQRAEAYRKQDIEALVKIQGEFVYSEPGTEELKRLVLEQRLKLPSETILSFYDPDPEANVTHLLGSLALPTLVTHGTEDQLISFEIAEHLANEIPDAQLYAFEGKGHLPIFTATAEFCEVLRRFVRREQVSETPNSCSDRQLNKRSQRLLP